MTTRRIYAATNGNCLVRNTPTVDETERKRMKRDFRSRVRLVVDSSNNEVRGFLPVTRTSPEAFFAVVHLDDADDGTNPLDLFWSEVTAEFKKRPNWTLRTDTSEGRFLRIIAGERPRNRDLNAILGRDDLRDEPATVGVSSIEIAGELIRELYDSPGSTGTKTTVVSGTDVSHIDYDILYWYRDQKERVKLLTQEEKEDRKTTSSGSGPSAGPLSLLRRLVRWLWGS